MARSVVNEKAAKAAAARARMAKRAKRARWMKENKKRIMMICAAFAALVFLAFFTPFGPDWYYGSIQNKLMESPGRLSPNSIKKLYSLGRFYQSTMRSNSAVEIYDEIGRYYFGVTLQEYARSPGAAFEKRRLAEIRIKKGDIPGPPFVIPDEEVRYVALAIYQMGEIIQRSGSKQFAYNIYKELYLEELKEEFPSLMDPEVTQKVQNYVDRVLGRR